jgi:hypothetical protein
MCGGPVSSGAIYAQVQAFVAIDPESALVIDFSAFLPK